MPYDRFAKPRVKGVSIYRPFVFGSVAKPFTDDFRPAGVNAEHTHQWRVYVQGVDGEDISYWLKRVQFKLHETYADALRTVEAPPFEVMETGWGEFDVQIKLHFVAEANEKAATLWHGLKLHPYGPDAEGQRERKESIVSQHYEEILFNEPSEALFEVLTSGPPAPQSAVAGRGKGSKGSKQSSSSAAAQATTRRGALAGPGGGGGGERTAEIPHSDTPGNPYSQKTEGAELDRLHEALKTVDAMVNEERARMEERERILKELQCEAAKGK